MMWHLLDAGLLQVITSKFQTLFPDYRSGCACAAPSVHGDLEVASQLAYVVVLHEPQQIPMTTQGTGAEARGGALPDWLPARCAHHRCDPAAGVKSHLCNAQQTQEATLAVLSTACFSKLWLLILGFKCNGVPIISCSAHQLPRYELNAHACSPSGYSLNIGKEHTDFVEAALQQRLIERKLTDDEVDKMAIMAMSGVSAEAQTYEEVASRVFWALCLSCRPFLCNA